MFFASFYEIDETASSWRSTSLIDGGINSPAEGNGVTIRIHYSILNARLAAGAVSAAQGGGVDQAYDGWRVVSQSMGDGVESGHSLKPPE